MADRIEVLREFDILGSLPGFFLEDIEIAAVKAASEMKINGPARSEAKLSFTVENISRLQNGVNVLSPITFVRNLPWRVLTGVDLNSAGVKALRFYLVCVYSGTDGGLTWDCKAKATLRLVAHDPGTQSFVRTIDHLFTAKKDNWGYSEFIKWSALVEPANGYVRDDSITLEVDLCADLAQRGSVVKRAEYFGMPGAIVVTQLDEVFAISSQVVEFLGFNPGSETSTFVHRMNAFCNRGIIGIAMGSAHFAAWTSKGEVLVWGANESGQLGIGSTGSSGKKPKRVGGILKKKRVVKVACGLDHTLCLTEDGEVFAMGSSIYCQSGSSKAALSPSRISFPDSDTTVTDVCSGHHSSYALMSDGSVFGWGLNAEGELGAGVDELAKSASPVKINIIGFVKKLACGPTFCLALTETKEVYFWGNNGSSATRILKPEKLFNSGDSIDDVAASIFGYTCFCSVDGAVVVWGSGWEANHIDFSDRRVTMFETIDKAIGSHKLSTSGFIRFSNTAKEVIALRPEYSCDVQFDVDGKVLEASKLLLMIRCEYFAKMYSVAWKESMNTGPLKVDLFTYSEFKAFLNFILTDRLIISDDLDSLIGMMKLADFYGCQSLQAKVSEEVEQLIEKSSALYIYSAALKYNAKSTRMIAVDYMAPKYVECVKAADVSKLDRDATLQLLVDLQAMKTFK